MTTYRTICALSTLLLSAQAIEKDVFAPPSHIDGVYPDQWFDCCASCAKYIRNNSTAEANRIQSWANRLLADPNDGEAFYSLSRAEVKTKMLRTALGAESEAYALLSRYRQLHNFPRQHHLTAEPSQHFALAMRNLLRKKTEGKELQAALHSMLEHDDSLSAEEICMLEYALNQWCHDAACPYVRARCALSCINRFRGRRVALSGKEAYEFAIEPFLLERFVLTEAGILQKPCTAIKDRPDWRDSVLTQLAWRHPEGAAALARRMHVPGFELLLCKEEALESYLRYKGVTHYRTLGQETPECCITALHAHRFASPEAAALLAKEQAAGLEPELRPLAPRCALACGIADWDPPQVTAGEPSPSWPDVSAVSLPMWRDGLLGAPAPDAFEADLAALSKHFSAVRERQSAGVILSAMMDECDRVRPDKHDLSTPVYLRMAEFFAADGIRVDREKKEHRILCPLPATNPVVAEALHKIPQHLHRVALALAVMEKRGYDLDAPCSRLAQELNRHNLWPLIICQRELRGFSTHALLALFSHYEGERAPLPSYGEAMGLEHEMNIAALGHEDDLGANLLRAGRISGAIPATKDEKREAVDFFMAMAREHAEDASPRLAGDILQHLLRWNAWEPVAAWKGRPVRFFQQHYAINGLRLVRSLLAAGRREEAAQTLAAMKADAKTDTTPACRLAESLLATDDEQAAALRTDALLLATLFQEVDFSLYETYLEELAAMGESPDHIIRSELIRTWGKSAGISEAVAHRFEQLGDWEKATFAWEYLIATGISTATPYGHIPSQADIYRYRLAANACRERIQAGESPAPATQAEEILAILPSRPWPLKDGGSIEGKLAGYYRSLGAIRLLRPDGTSQIVPLDSLADDEEGYFNEWRQANGLEHWQVVNWHTFSEDPIHSRLAGARVDLLNPGHYYARFLTESGSIQIIHTLHMFPKEEFQRISDFGSKNASSPFSPPLSVTSDFRTAKRLAEERGLPILVLSNGGSNNDSRLSLLQEYISYHPEATSIWSRQFVLLVLARQQKDNELIWHYPDALCNDLEACEREWNPEATRTSQVRRILDATNIDRYTSITCCWLGKGIARCGYVNLDYLTPPEELFKRMQPLEDESPRSKYP